MKNLFFGKPNIIIKEGSVNQLELKKLRMSINELLSELRLKDIDDISTVDYAILEQNGKLSVFEKKKTAGRVDKSDFCYAIITDGEINKTDLENINKTEEWLQCQLKKQKLTADKIFLMTSTRQGKTNIILKEET